MLDIPALRKLCEAATKGPWTFADNQRGPWRMEHFKDDEWLAIERELPSVSGPSCVFQDDAGHIRPCDSAFIAAARTALPAALAEIESLRAELAAAREKKPVAYCAMADDGYIGQYGDPAPVAIEFLERAKDIPAYCDPSHGKYRVVPLIIPPGAGG